VSGGADAAAGSAHAVAPIDWVTFDCYGTLIDWERGIADALAPFAPAGHDRRALAARYIACEAEVEREAYRPYRDVLAEASARLLARLGARLPEGRERTLPESLARWPAFRETPAALRALAAAGRRLAILSNVDRDLIAHSLPRLGVAPVLVITAEDCGSYKPAPGHWERFERESGASPARTLHVGASLYHDMAPAGRRGYRTVFVNRGSEPVVGAAPTRVIPDLAPLPQAVGEIERGERRGE
jgi:2-haloalkanoic acid dehalogenase type II